MPSVTKGTAHVWGITPGVGAPAGITVQSYTISEGYEIDDRVQNASGITITHRLDGKTKEISVEGVLLTSGFTLEVGQRLQFAGNEHTFDGLVTRIEDRGQSKGFSLVSITAVSYEGITSYS